MDNFNKLMECSREDEVKSLITELLGITLDMRHNIDCYTQNILFEFKFETDVKKPIVLAQVLYYLNTLHNLGDHIPAFSALVNQNELVIFETNNLFESYKNNDLFKSGSPSSPSNEVIEEAKKYINTLYYYCKFETEEDFANGLSCLREIIRNKKIVPDKIKSSNVKRAFQGYVRQLGDYIVSQSNSSGVFEFRADAIGKAIIVNKDVFGNYKINFQFENGAKTINNISSNAYDSYWKQWKRIDDVNEANEVFKTIYDLLGFSDRRTKGQFYTPPTLAREGWKRIINVLGDNFWADGTWRIWDCCAGTGNLENDIIPASAMQYLYLSTLDIEEVDQLVSKFPIAKCIFQYDFLNDHFNKYPEQLKQDINNPNLKWLIFINPPYVEAQGVSNVQSGVAESNIQSEMDYFNLSNAAREMFAQFLYRIEKELKNRYFMGLFCAKKIISSKKFEAFRSYFRPIYKGGFVVNAKDHFQCPGEWPIIYSLFDRRNQIPFDSEHWQNLNFDYDIFDKNCNIIGTKHIKVYDKNRDFRLFFDDNSIEPLTTRMPFLSSAIKLSTKRTYNNPLVPDSFLATMQFIGSNLQQQDKCYFASGIINNNHNNIVITTNNYKNCLIGFGLYKSVSLNWMNKEDVLEYCSRDLTEEEKTDALLYALLSSYNNTATYRFDSGEIVINKLNPLDDTLFDFSTCSEVGRKAYDLLVDYLENKVNYKSLTTRFGKGVFMGLYQYQTEPDSDHLDCFGIKYTDEFNQAIEDLRAKVEQTANEVCF